MNKTMEKKPDCKVALFSPLIIAFCLLLFSSSATAITVDQGQLTSTITWSISKASDSSTLYHLSITGTGAMPNWSSGSG